MSVCIVDLSACACCRPFHVHSFLVVEVHDAVGMNLVIEF